MASLNAMFKVNNLSSEDFIQQKHSFNVQDLIDDKTDAMAVYLSNEPYHMIEKKIPYTNKHGITSPVHTMKLNCIKML